MSDKSDIERRNERRRRSDLFHTRLDQGRQWLGLIFIAVAFLLIHNQGNSTSHAVKSADGTARLLVKQTKVDTGARASVVRVICGAVDANAKLSDSQTALFQAIVVDGAKQSKIFDALYRQYGGPPYGTRVSAAERLSRHIGQLRAQVVDCGALARYVEQSSVTPRPVPIPRAVTHK